MKIIVMGSAAYERIPALFCNCPVCQTAKKLGGRNIRTEAQVLIDDELLVDFGQDNYLHFLTGAYDFTKIKNILITHSHSDHYIPENFSMTVPPYGHNDIEKLGVFGNAECGELFKKMGAETKAEYTAVKPYETFSVGKFTVTALPASHGTVCPLCYVITSENKTLLYNNDTGIFADEVYDFLKSQKYKFDAVIADSTVGFLPTNGKRHMSFENNVMHKARLERIGVVDASTKYIINHFSHNGLIKDGRVVTAEMLEKIASDNGMICAYDGFTIEI